MFKDINFRYSDAKEESKHSPELIEKAFVDINNILEDVMQPEKFIVIGSKGSGKSALSAKLQQHSNEKWDFFSAEENLENFDFKNISRSTSNSSTLTNGYADAWQMVIMIRFLSLFLQDENIDGYTRIFSLDSNLKKHGLSNSQNLTYISEYTSRKGIFSTLRTVFMDSGISIGSETKNNIKTPGAIAETIKEILGKIKFDFRKSYYLIIDGLDYLLSFGKENTKHIKDLIVATKQLNDFFSESKINAKIIILIRDEILAIIPDANLSKRINDNGISLNWFENARAPLQTSLLKIIEMRSHLAGYTESIDALWKQWFPDYIRGKQSFQFILNNTRYIPRDLVSFFRELQKLSSNPPFSEETVLSACANYSDWFFGELRDSLVGLIDEEIRINLGSILTNMGREFNFEKFSKNIHELGYNTAKPGEILHCMFETSLIGNVWKTDQGTDRFAWKHRKKNASFMPTKQIIIHSGLWKALNLI